MFSCPNCSNTLQTAKTAIGSFWVCTSCGGRSATVAMLRKALPKDTVNTFWQNAKSGDHDKKRACPACEKLMFEVPVDGNEKMELVDVCTTCQVVWFDPSEYEAMPQKEIIEPESKELSLEARERLAKFEIEHIRDHADNEDWSGPITILEYALHLMSYPLR